MAAATAAAGVDDGRRDVDGCRGAAAGTATAWYRNADGAAGGRLVVAEEWRRRRGRSVTVRGSVGLPYSTAAVSEDARDDGDDDGDVAQVQQQQQH